MCFKISKPKHSEKDYIMAPRDPDVVVYYYEIGKKDVKCFRVAEYEDAFVICPNGDIKPIEKPGFYEVISVPAKVVWVRSGKFVMTIGVPRGVLPGGFGVHADVALYLRSPEALLKSMVLSGKEGKITMTEVKDELRRLLEDAVKNLQIDPKMDRKNIVEQVHGEMNQLIVRSWLGGFYCDVQSVGFSFECELSKLIDELAR